MTDAAIFLTFTGRRQLFFQLTPMETAGTIGEIPVSSVLFSSAADNTSVSK